MSTEAAVLERGRAGDDAVSVEVMGWTWRRWRKDVKFPEDSICEVEQWLDVEFLMEPRHASLHLTEKGSGAPAMTREQVDYASRFRAVGATVMVSAMLPPRYTEDLEAAMDVVGEMRARGAYARATNRPGDWTVKFLDEGLKLVSAGTAPGLALAVCRAAVYAARRKP